MTTVELFTRATVAWTAVTSRIRDERGEGVISAAIAVLIIAFVGVAAFAVFSGLLEGAGSRASAQVDRIGTP